MPQEQHILRCYSCEAFQVHIVKKALKWECKVCREKQSLKKVYGRGSGKDCRLHVQRLNELRLRADEDIENHIQHFLNPLNETDTKSDDTFASSASCKTDKWAEFVPVDESSNELENMQENYTFERPGKRRKQAQGEKKFGNKILKLNKETRDTNSSWVTDEVGEIKFEDNASRIGEILKSSNTNQTSTKWDEYQNLNSNVSSENGEEFFGDTIRLHEGEKHCYTSSGDVNNKTPVKTMDVKNLFDSDGGDFDTVLDF